MIKDDSYCLACKSVLHQKEFFHDINSLTCGPSQSRGEEASSGEEMSAIFSITTDINDILLVLDRSWFFAPKTSTSTNSCQGINPARKVDSIFDDDERSSKPIMTRRSNEAKKANNFLIGIYRHDGPVLLQKPSFWPRSKSVKTSYFYIITVFENLREVSSSERSELRLHFEWTKID